MSCMNYNDISRIYDRELREYNNLMVLNKKIRYITPTKI